MDLEQIVSFKQEEISEKTRAYFLDLLTYPEEAFATKKKYDIICRDLSRKHKIVPSKVNLFKLVQEVNDKIPSSLKEHMIQKAVRSSSGILNVSVSLPPNEFSCKYNCYFCPNEPGMPRSYLSNEDVFKRAARVNFNTVDQVYSRLLALERNGHIIDKLEFRVLGGTFSSYDDKLADEFIRDLYYGANTYTSRSSVVKREKKSIEEEQEMNVTADVHVVGLGIETRPDSINHSEILRFRKYGVTRVEIGVQHTDDALLRRVNRGHGVKQSRKAVKLLKEYGFKVEIHIMADLPGATPEGDKECYKEVLTGPDLIPDYMKDYPCLDVDFTKIKEWKKSGEWTPYAEKTPDAKELVDVLIYRQAITPKWVRVNRIQRDFQSSCDGTRLGYTSDSIKSNLAQLVKDAAEKQGVFCQCIRCCELRDEKFDEKDIVYSQDWFLASGTQEVFLSASIPRKDRNLLLGFLRLRLPSSELEESVIDELKGKTAMIRELHVYGRMTAVGKKQENGTAMSAQHRGIGKTLLKLAEEIAFTHEAEKMAVISGIGVRGYYQKNGYELRGSYMMKDKVIPIPIVKENPDYSWMLKDCIWDIILAILLSCFFKYF